MDIVRLLIVGDFSSVVDNSLVQMILFHFLGEVLQDQYKDKDQVLYILYP